MNAIVMTTINSPHNLYKFIEKANGEWTPIVVGDLKTPHDSVNSICRHSHGVYLSPDMQLKLGFSHIKTLPWNCYDRKNIGYLFALKEGADIIYSTDDDNYPPDHWDSYVKLGKQRAKVVNSESGWWNCYSLGNLCITPRGYPYDLLHDRPRYTYEEKEVDVAVQNGLCIGEPDTDAMTRLLLNPIVDGYSDEDIALGEITMCPYNSQNTFFTREMAPAHMLWCGAKTPFYRFDDIFASYVAQAICRHHGKTVKFGRPFLRQRRNPHDLIKDLKSEIGGMECQPSFFSSLALVDFRSDRIADNLKQIVYRMLEEIPELPRRLKDQVDTWCADLEVIGL